MSKILEGHVVDVISSQPFCWEFGRSQLTLWKLGGHIMPNISLPSLLPPGFKKLSTPLNRVNVSDNIWSGPVPTSLYVPAGLMSTSTSIYSTMNFLRQN